MKQTISVPFGKFIFYNVLPKHRDYFKTQFQNIPYREGTKITLTVTFKPLKPKNVRSLENTFFADKDYFYVADTKGKLTRIKFSNSSSHPAELHVDPDFDLYYLYSFILEPLMIINAAAKQILYVHASAISSPKTGAVVFVAWRHTGKTDSILHATDHGYQFLGDDYCVLHKKLVYLYPKNVNIFSYNLLRFPRLFNSLNWQTQVRLKVTLIVKKTLEWAATHTQGALSKIFFRVGQLAEVSTNIKLDPTQLGMTVQTVAPLRTIVSLEKSTTNTRQLTAKLSSAQFQTKLVSIMNYELADFFNYYRAFQYFFPSRKIATIENYSSAVSQLVVEYSKQLKTYYLAANAVVDFRALGLS